VSQKSNDLKKKEKNKSTWTSLKPQIENTEIKKEKISK